MYKKFLVLLMTFTLTISSITVYAGEKNDDIIDLDNTTTEEYFIDKENSDIKFILDDNSKLLEDENIKTTDEKLPDLRLYNIEVKEGEKYPFEAMKPARVTYIVANYGLVDATNIVIGLRVNGTLVFKYKYRDVEARTGYISTLQLENFKEGTFEIALFADVDNNVIESNEVNNWSNKYFKWVKPSREGTWYSQVAPNYNNDNLHDLFFPYIKNSKDGNGKVISNEKMRNTPLEWNYYDEALGNYEAPGGKECFPRGHINKWGCVVSSLAMVLNNLRVETKNKQYDFRTDKTTYLKPDPFTVTMANMGFPKITTNVIDKKTRYEILDYAKDETPVYVYSKPDVCSYFGYTSTDIDTSKYTKEEISDTLVKLLKDHPEGVCAKVDWHYIVIMNYVKENIEKGEEYEDNFIVCDPGTTYENKGNNVKYTDSYAKGKIGGIEYIVTITYLTKE